MNRLALELSTEEKSVAIQTLSGSVHERSWPEDRSKPDPLYEMLDAVRMDAGLSWEDLTGVIVGRGPGQYSGMRAAVSAAQGLALPGGIPVTGVSSGAAQAWRMLRDSERALVAVLGDARRQRWWMGMFDLDPGGLRSVTDWALYTDEDVVAAVSASTAYVVTSDWDRCSEALQVMFPGRELLHPGAFFPRASDLLSLHASRTVSGMDPESPLPIYLHPAVAVPEGDA
jgi:tRNA threonylcarbamoyladenosine biosynthesis protein TsaB